MDGWTAIREVCGLGIYIHSSSLQAHELALVTLGGRGGFVLYEVSRRQFFGIL